MEDINPNFFFFSDVFSANSSGFLSFIFGNVNNIINCKERFMLPMIANGSIKPLTEYNQAPIAGPKNSQSLNTLVYSTWNIPLLSSVTNGKSNPKEHFS